MVVGRTRTRQPKVLRSTAEHDGTGSPIIVGNDIVETDEVVEYIRPKTGTQVGTCQHGTNGIVDGLVGMFGRKVLAGGVGAGQLDLVTTVVEGDVDLVALDKLTTTVHSHILVGTVGGIVGKPLIKPVYRGGGYGSERTAKDAAAEVIGEEHVAGFAVEADKALETLEVTAVLDHESKVNAEALHALSGGHDGAVSARGNAEFGG